MAGKMEGPEARYREGYEEGAWALFKELERFLPTCVAEDALAWLENQIGPWRLDAQRAAVDGADTPNVLPPPVRIPPSS